ncbi:hypothetical protein BESB_067870 [Besnoitia besnoiti]|uniref:Tic22-like family protein n=1 Tax=Besnoitia besnoiti TaxID=94643 RepID=A0A2A9MC04_BESBE|nr:hypothetical protein BESB_067870 [Besnoitia besnoiti]PFH34754.1 hypothetical protein BESB_067870 [Besnoitia besnoiti]
MGIVSVLLRGWPRGFAVRSSLTLLALLFCLLAPQCRRSEALLSTSRAAAGALSLGRALGPSHAAAPFRSPTRSRAAEPCSPSPHAGPPRAASVLLGLVPLFQPRSRPPSRGEEASSQRCSGASTDALSQQKRGFRETEAVQVGAPLFERPAVVIQECENGGDRAQRLSGGAERISGDACERANAPPGFLFSSSAETPLPRGGEIRRGKRKWWKYFLPLWPPWKTRYSRRPLAEKLLCIPVYVVVNRFGAPFLSPPSPALIAELQKRKEETGEASSLPQTALAFLDGQEATEYLHELIQSNPGGPQVEARLYCIPLSTIWDQICRVVVDPRLEAAQARRVENAAERRAKAASEAQPENGGLFAWRSFLGGDSVADEEDEKAREREEDGRRAVQPQVLWQLVPSKKQVQNARLHARFSELREGTGVPIFYADLLSVERDGESVVALFFSLEDLHAVWERRRQEEAQRERSLMEQRRARVSKPGMEYGKEENEEGKREVNRPPLPQQPPVKVLNLLKLLLAQAEQPKGEMKVADGCWGFVPSSASLAFLEEQKRRGVGPARLLFGPDETEGPE